MKKKLISTDKLNKMRQEQEDSLEKTESLLFSGVLSGGIHGLNLDETSHHPTSPIMEEEKIDENPFTHAEAELTASDYSYLSYLESNGKKSKDKSSLRRQGRSAEGSGSGVIIKRMNSKVEVESI